MDPSWSESGAGPTAMGNAQPPSQPKASPFILWHAAGDSLVVEFSRLALEQIRQACFAASNGPLRQKLGTGGLLLGTRVGAFRRVLGWRMIEHDYSSGQPLQLRGEEESMLWKQLQGPFQPGMQPVGWFASHPRGGLSLTLEERRIHELFFSAGEQLMLTMRILRSGDLAMVIHAPSSNHDGLLQAREPEIRIVPMLRSELETALKDAETPLEEPPAPPVLPEPAVSRHSAYFGFGFAVCLVVASAIAILSWQVQQPTAPAAARSAAPAAAAHPKRLLSLHARHESSRLRVEWDPLAYDISEISAASISCISDSRTRTYRVGPRALRNGRFTVALRSPPDNVVLSIHTADRNTIQETVNFVDPPKKN